MAYRWRGKYFEVDPDDPRAEGICDRCGLRHNLHRLKWQYAYQGSTMLQNTRFLVCYKCYDPPNPQDMPFILPPDPEPIFNTRPEPYTLDEQDILADQLGNQLSTVEGSLFTPNEPNPTSPAVQNENSIIEEAETDITDESGNQIVEESSGAPGDPNDVDPLDYDP